MADIQGKILSKYGIDINQDNIFKLYKIESADISDQELVEKIDATRKRWNQSINGANEKNAARDKARLDKADKYEAILKDVKLRKEVFAFYQGDKGSANSNSSDSSVPLVGVDFAREFFKLVQTTKKLKQEDVDFFFDYYQSQRKHKKAIYEMLEKEFKIAGLKKKNADSEKEVDADELEGKEKDESSPLIVNLFSKATILKLSKCMQNFDSVASNQEVLLKYPSLRDGLYEFLGLKNIETIDEFKKLISDKNKEVYSVRQEKGVAFNPLVDVLNTLQDLSKFSDVVDNLSEFKLLIKYPTLTPYMYEFLDMKNETVKGIYGIANRDYVFRDEADFILNYFNPVHDNFNIDTSSIGSIIRKAEKKAKANKILNDLDEKMGRKKKRGIPISASIIHGLVYWPIFAVYFVFEVFKAIATEVHRFTIPVFAVLFIASNWLFPGITGIENILYLRKVFFKAEWLSYLSDVIGRSTGNAFEAITASLAIIILTLMLYILPSFFIAWFVSATADNLRQRYDWMGLERTFQNIFERLKQKTESQYQAQPKLFFKSKISKIIVNLVSLAIVVTLVYFAPVGFRTFSEKTGYFQKTEKARVEQHNDDAEEELAEEEFVSEDASDTDDNNELEMVITASEGNIRAGVGTDYDVVMQAKKGDTFVATGNEEKASNGRVWYEIYLNDEKSETGWASQKIIEFK